MLSIKAQSIKKHSTNGQHLKTLKDLIYGKVKSSQENMNLALVFIQIVIIEYGLMKNLLLLKNQQKMINY